MSITPSLADLVNTVPVISKQGIILKAVCVIVCKFVKHEFSEYKIILHVQYC